MRCAWVGVFAGLSFAFASADCGGKIAPSSEGVDTGGWIDRTNADAETPGFTAADSGYREDSSRPRFDSGLFEDGGSCAARPLVVCPRADAGIEEDQRAAVRPLLDACLLVQGVCGQININFDGDGCATDIHTRDDYFDTNAPFKRCLALRLNAARWSCTAGATVMTLIDDCTVR